ncbi:alternate gene name: yztA [Bacillus subtilis E1]|nr:hypothetical protein BSn5_15930 [Bacillus subtilis BSn5]AKE22640.1 hypothetical protein BsLM_0841 [Bacillus sp. LM 4-2]CCU59913.1 alternate gene name: yztA [Bacillus subtilis E1]
MCQRVIKNRCRKDGGIGYVKYSIDFLSKAAIQSNDAEELGS